MPPFDFPDVVVKPHLLLLPNTLFLPELWQLLGSQAYLAFRGVKESALELLATFPPIPTSDEIMLPVSLPFTSPLPSPCFH
jgi:hypothetical protein